MAEVAPVDAGMVVLEADSKAEEAFPCTEQEAIPPSAAAPGRPSASDGDGQDRAPCAGDEAVVNDSETPGEQVIRLNEQLRILSEAHADVLAALEAQKDEQTLHETRMDEVLLHLSEKDARDSGAQGGGSDDVGDGGGDGGSGDGEGGGGGGDNGKEDSPGLPGEKDLGGSLVRDLRGLIQKHRAVSGEIHARITSAVLSTQAPAEGLLSKGGARHIENQDSNEASENKNGDDVSATGGGEEKTERPAVGSFLNKNTAHTHGWNRGHVNKGDGDEPLKPCETEIGRIDKIFEGHSKEAVKMFRIRMQKKMKEINKQKEEEEESRSIICCGNKMSRLSDNKKYFCCGDAFNKDNNDDHPTISLDPVKNTCAAYINQKWARDLSVMR